MELDKKYFVCKIYSNLHTDGKFDSKIAYKFEHRRYTQTVTSTKLSANVFKSVTSWVVFKVDEIVFCISESILNGISSKISSKKTNMKTYIVERLKSERENYGASSCR